MKKKLLVLFLSAMMVFSLVACSGDETTDGNDQQVEQNADVEDEADADVEDDVVAEDFYFVTIADHETQMSYELPAAVDNTTWNFAGGLIEGVEMNGEEGLAVLEEFDGTFDLVFGNDGTTVQMVTGAGTINGEYMYGEDNDGVFLVMENGEMFSCAYTEVPDENGNNVSVFIAYVIEEADLEKDTLTAEDLSDAFYFIFAE